MERLSKLWHSFPLELIFWVSALIALSLAKLPPDAHTAHFTLCPLANLGISWCPGCGIGRAIAALLQGHLAESFEQHWFGLPALLIICWRIFVLGRLTMTKDKF